MYVFEVTVDDVINVFMRNDMSVTTQYAEAVLGDLCLFRITKASMYGDDTNEQTELAYREIERQLKIRPRG